jgi:dUTPase
VLTVNVYRLRDDLELPTFGTTLANCFDLSFQPTNTECIVKGYNKYNDPVTRHVHNFSGGLRHGNEDEFEIEPGDRLLVPTGLIFKIELLHTIETYADISRTEMPLQNYSIRLHPRSGLSLKRGLVLANSEGIVDVDYQEEVFVLLTNISQVSQRIKRGDRIAQAEIVCNEPTKFIIATKRPEKHSERAGGFGSTGV